MGRRGPAPLTREALRLRRSWRADQLRDQPEAPLGRPACPKWLDKDAKGAWRRLIPQLEQMRVLSAADRNAIARYCQLWARWKRAELFLQQYGDTYPLKDPNGNIRCFMPWPQVAIAGKLAVTLTRLEQEFGLTPSSRTRIMVNPKAARRFETPHEQAVREFFSARPTPVPPPKAAG